MLVIKTERLLLRKPRVTDKPQLIAGLGNWAVAKWLSRVPYPYTEQHADEWLRSGGAAELNFSICENDVLIGGIALSPDQDNHTLGFWLCESRWGFGYATEAGEALLGCAVETLGIRNIVARHMRGNLASANVLAKLGFVAAGQGKSYCLSRREYRPHINLLLLPPHQSQDRHGRVRR